MRHKVIIFLNILNLFISIMISSDLYAQTICSISNQSSDISIDGIEGDQEGWPDDPNVNIDYGIGNPLYGDVKAFHTAEYIYLFFNINDVSDKPTDALWIRLDKNHDHTIDDSDVGFGIFRDNSAISGTLSQISGNWGDYDESNYKVISSTTSWTVEIRISIPPSAYSGGIGIFFMLYDMDSAFSPNSVKYTQWPAPSESDTDGLNTLFNESPDKWGNYVFDPVSTFPNISLTGVRRAGAQSNYYKISYGADNIFEVKLRNHGGTMISDASDVRVNLYLAAIGIGESWHRLDKENLLDTDCDDPNWISYVMPDKTDFCSGTLSLPDISTTNMDSVVENTANYTIKSGEKMNRLGYESTSVNSGFDEWVPIINWNTTLDQDEYFKQVTVNGSAYNRQHSCMRAEAVYAHDPNPSDNVKQKNMNFVGLPGDALSSLHFSLGWAGFSNYNSYDGKDMYLDVEWKNINPKDGWRYKLEGADAIGPNTYKVRISGLQSIPMQVSVAAPRPKIFIKIQTPGLPYSNHIMVPANAGGRSTSAAIPSGVAPVYLDVKSGSTLLISSFSQKETDGQSVVVGGSMDIVPKNVPNGPAGLSLGILKETLNRVDEKYRYLLVPDAPLGSLVGSFDDFKTGFNIAEGVQVRVPQGANKLALGVNSLIGLYDSNEGTGFQVKILDRSKAISRLKKEQGSSDTEDQTKEENIQTKSINDNLPALWINGYEDTDQKHIIGGTTHELFRYIGNVGYVVTDIYPSKRFEIVLPFIGRFSLDKKLGLNDGNTIGAKFGYIFSYQFAAELEGGITSSSTNGGKSGTLTQLLINGRGTLTSFPVGQMWMTTYGTAGAGYMLFRGFGTNDGALACQVGAGSTLEIKSWLGIKIDYRLIRIGDVTKPETTTSTGQTTNTQTTAGLVFCF